MNHSAYQFLERKLWQKYTIISKYVDVFRTSALLQVGR